MRFTSGFIALGFALLSACSAPQTASDLLVEQTWARATPPGTTVGAVYTVVSNSGGSDRLLAVESDISPQVEIHESRHVDGIAQMRKLEGVEIPAGGRVAFEPATLHLMLNDLRRPLIEGESLSLVFIFEKAGRIPATANIAPLDYIGTAQEQGAHDHQH